MAKAKKLFTIGYEQTPAEIGARRTRARRREAPGRRARRRLLAPAGLFQEPARGRTGRARHCLPASARTRHAKDGRDAARSGKFELLHKIYATHLKTAQAREELDELSSLVKKSGPVCILCYERDHLHCHRQWIAEIIEERDGVKVENLARAAGLKGASFRGQRPSTPASTPPSAGHIP